MTRARYDEIFNKLASKISDITWTATTGEAISILYREVSPILKASKIYFREQDIQLVRIDQDYRAISIWFYLRGLTVWITISRDSIKTHIICSCGGDGCEGQGQD